jgi:hypothetical protein
LRRRSAQQVTEMMAQECDQEQVRILEAEKDWTPAKPAVTDVPERPSWILKVDKAFSLNLFTAKDLEDVHEVVFDLGRLADEEIESQVEFLAQRVGKERIRLALPVIQRDTGLHKWRGILRRLFVAGYRKWQISNLGALPCLAEVSVTPQNTSITADWPLYVHNTAAARYLLEEVGLKRVTLSIDDPQENTLELLKCLGGVAEVPVFQDTALAISAVCANVSLKGHCDGDQCEFREMTLENRAGEKLLVINDHCQSVYLRKEPLQREGLATKAVARGAKLLRADFCWRDWSPRKIHEIWQELH